MMFRDRSAAYQALGVVLILGLLTVEPFPGRTFAEELNGVRLLEEMQNAFINLADRVKPAVVNISPVSVSAKSGESLRERGPNNQGTGSGVIVDKDGTVVTNNHVVADAKEVEVRLSDKSKYIGQVIGRDPDTDLAVVKITADRDLPTVPFGDSSKVRVGQWAMAVGNPFSLDRTVTVGVVSGLERDAVRLSRYEAFIQTDASINPGNSGGPLFNIKGEVIGINTAIINYAQGIGFAIPSNMVQQVVNQLRSKGKVVRGWLGIGIQEVTPELAAKFGIKESDGILVNDVFENEPAARAGLKPGDLIKEVNRQIVTTAEEFKTAVAQTKKGDSVLLRVVRENRAFYSVLSPKEK